MRMRPARFMGGPRPANPAANAVRITQSYPAAAKIGRDDKTVLCYGVEDAKVVRSNPPVEQVWPAVARCFDVVLPRSTTYVWTAGDAPGQTTPAEAGIEAGPPRPKLGDVSISMLEVSPAKW